MRSLRRDCQLWSLGDFCPLGTSTFPPVNEDSNNCLNSGVGGLGNITPSVDCLPSTRQSGVVVHICSCRTQEVEVG